MKTKQTQSRIERGLTKLVVPHLDEELTFIYPAKGPGNYTNVGNEIEQASLTRPTFSQTISLLHSAYCDLEVENEPEFKDIRNIMKKRWLWAFTRNLWTPEGVYTYDNLDGKPKDEAYLSGQLESENESVRFIPKGFKLEERTPKQLEKNPYIIALSNGEEQAEKLSQVADKFKKKPYVVGLKDVSENTQRVSALDSGWGGSRLFVRGNYFGNDSNGSAFGVLNSGEASARKK